MTSDAFPTAPAKVKRRAPRWMWVLLVLSLACNLMVVGVIIGVRFAEERRGYWEASATLQRVQRFMNGLKPERRAEIRNTFFQYRDRLKPNWNQVREARLRIGDLIERGGYSQEELSAAIDDLYAKESRARAANKPLVLAIIAKLEPQERLHFLRVFLPYLNDLQGKPEPASREGGLLGQGR